MPAQLKDFSMFYIKEGKGEPLILIHGNGESHKIFLPAIKKLSKYFTVYAIDSRNHGKSTCNVLHYNYVQMAKDVKEFMEVKKIKKAHLYGFSDGGIIAMIFAILFPESILSLSMSGVNIHPKGLKLYARIYMRFQYLFSNDLNKRKLNELMLKHPHIPLEKLQSISCPCLLTVGKHDIIKRNHTLKIKENLKQCHLVIVKGGNHFNYIVQHELIANILLDFFKKEKM